MTTLSTSQLPDLADRTIIITGANSGIGLATARAVAGAGAHVVFAVRDVAKGERAAAGTSGATEVRELDLADLGSVRAFASSWDAEIDLLINNAGVSPRSLSRTADGFEQQFGTNHLGHFALTNLLLSKITGRVIVVGSQAERMGRIDFDDPNFQQRPYKQMQAYCQSKLANILFTAELQRRLTTAGSDVLAQTAHPGFVATEIYAEGGTPAKAIIRRTAQSSDQGALPVLYAAVGDVPGDSFTGPKHLMHMRGAPELIRRSRRAGDTEVARRLWSLSEELTGTQFPLTPTGNVS